MLRDRARGLQHTAVCLCVRLKSLATEGVVLKVPQIVSRPVFQNFALLVAALLVALALTEIGLRLFVTLRYVGPPYTVYDPTYGHALKNSSSTKRITPEYTMRLTTNSFGFRGPEPESFPHRPVLFLGDSFTLGIGVNDGEEYPALVGNGLRAYYGQDDIPIVNAGMSHTGQGRWVKFLTNVGKRYNPRVVVLQFVENDFNDNLRERLFELSPTGELVELPVPPPSRARAVQRVIEAIPGFSRTHLLGLMRQIYIGHFRPDPTADRTDSMSPQQYALTFRLLERVLDICQEADWPVLGILIAPEGPQFAELARIFERYNVPIIEIDGNEMRPELYYPKDGHWNAVGHSFVAGRVVEELVDWGIGSTKHADDAESGPTQ